MANLRLNNGPAPSTPPAGYTAVYTKADKLLYFKDDVGVEYTVGALSDTDSLPEGITNLYFTDERAQDAVGAIVTNSSKVSLTYVDGTPSLTADILPVSLTNADISASAAIAYSKLAALTANRATVTDGSGVVTVSPTTDTELSYLSGVTSAIQTQIDNKQASDSDLTALAGISSTGLLARTGAGTATVRTIQGNTQVGVANGDGVAGDPTLSINAASITNAQISASAAIAYSKLSLTGSIVNADVSGSAAITYSKLSLTGSLVNADVNAAAAIAYSKLNLTGNIVNADVNASAAIAYSKLALSNSIVNADINTAAAIDRSKLASGTAHYFVRNSSTGALTETFSQYNPKKIYTYYEDFVANAIGSLPYIVSTNSGAGSGTLTNLGPDQINNIGIADQDTGSTATGRCTLNANVNNMYFGAGEVDFEAYIKFPILSSSSERFTYYLGFGDTTASGDMTDGVYFTYADNVNSGNWVLNAANNAVRTTTNTSTAAGTGWTHMRININAAGTLATFYINGVSVGTVAGNIPNPNGRECSILSKLEKSVGTTSRHVYMDYWMHTLQFTTSRG